MAARTARSLIRQPDKLDLRIQQTFGKDFGGEVLVLKDQRGLAIKASLNPDIFHQLRQMSFIQRVGNMAQRFAVKNGTCKGAR